MRTARLAWFVVVLAGLVPAALAEEPPEAAEQEYPPAETVGTNLPLDESSEVPAVASGPRERPGDWAEVARIVRGGSLGGPAPGWLADDYRRVRERHDGRVDEEDARIVIHGPYGWRAGLSRIQRHGVFLDPWPLGPRCGPSWVGGARWRLGVGFFLD